MESTLNRRGGGTGRRGRRRARKDRVFLFVCLFFEEKEKMGGGPQVVWGLLYIYGRRGVARELSAQAHGMGGDDVHSRIRQSVRRSER